MKSIKCSEIAETVNGEIVGDENVSIFNLNRVEFASQGELTFYSDPKFLESLESSNATCIIVPKNLDKKPDAGQTYIKVDDPYSAFTALLEEYNRILTLSKKGKESYASIFTPKEMRELKGIKTELQEEYGYTCEVVDFELTRVPKKDDPITERNNHSDFKGRVINLVKLAKSGDVYYVDQVKAKCPGDEEARYLNGLVFKVK